DAALVACGPSTRGAPGERDRVAARTARLRRRRRPLAGHHTLTASRSNRKRCPGDEADPGHPWRRRGVRVEETLAAEARVLRTADHPVAPVVQPQQVELAGERVRNKAARRVEHL